EYISAAAPPNHRWTHTDSTGCCCPVEIRDWCLAPRGGMANDPRLKDGPLDGSTSGTIGGGGPETGGPGERATVPDVPRSKPEDAARGRLTPDAIDAATPVDDLKDAPSDDYRRTPRHGYLGERYGRRRVTGRLENVGEELGRRRPRRHGDQAPADRLVAIHQVIGCREQLLVGAAVLGEHGRAGAGAEAQSFAGAYLELNL